MAANAGTMVHAMLCRVEMPANEQIFGRFYRWRMLHQKGAGMRTSLILLPVLAILAGLLMWSSVGPLPLAVAAVAVLGYLIYMMVIKPNSIFRKREGAALMTEVYLFTDTGFTRSVRSEEGGFPENLSCQYDILVRAVETGKDFFLFTSQSQAYLVDKEYFTKGGPEDLRKVLQKKLGKKFKGPK